MLIFPHWLNHQVHPFFGEGERRSLAANFNIIDSYIGANINIGYVTFNILL